MVVLYVYKKPLAIVRETIALLAQGESIMCAVLIVLGGAVVACILLLFRGAETDSIRSIPLMAGTAVLFAALPNIWAYSEFWAMSDFFLALLIFLQISVAILAVLATRQIRLWRHPALATTGRGAR
jgi:asparagine N-glycosylation enzyme membrane subunit Stt3